MTMDILLFAGLAEAAGSPRLELDGQLPRTAAELESEVRERWPALAAMPFRVAVNQAYAAAETPVGATDEIALIPPVGGG